LNLPGMSGREVLVAIKTDRTLKMIPTVILSTSNANDDLRYCYEYCANCYVKKPRDWDEFVHVVRSVTQYWFSLATLPDEIAFAAVGL
jgi:chemotaxis family two-component system response regulator Rcp1